MKHSLSISITNAKRSLLLTVLLLSTGLHSYASGHIWQLGADYRPSYTFSSYHDDIMQAMIDSEKAKKTIIGNSLHIQCGFSYKPDSPEGRLFPRSWQGIGAGMNFFSNPEGIGNPVSIYLFQGAPVWHIRHNLYLYYEWNFGLSMGWKPCDGETAYSNLITGSHMNAYINVGSGLQWHFSPGWSLMAGINLTHYSNGNTSYPNPGINMAGLRLGVTHTFGHTSPCIDNTSCSNPAADSEQTNVCTKDKSHSPHYNITMYGAWRKRVYRGGEKPILLNGHFGIVGLDFSPLWDVTSIFRAGPSLDLQWDESTNLRSHHYSGSTANDILFTRPSFLSQVSCGLSARAELVMPLFSVNIGIGYNAIGPEESRASYQLANLKIRIVKGFFLNVGYQLLDFHRQNNLMLGFGYTI